MEGKSCEAKFKTIEQKEDKAGDDGWPNSRMPKSAKAGKECFAPTDNAKSKHDGRGN
jgi:hypothetical protein